MSEGSHYAGGTTQHVQVLVVRPSSEGDRTSVALPKAERAKRQLV